MSQYFHIMIGGLGFIVGVAGMGTVGFYCYLLGKKHERERSWTKDGKYRADGKSDPRDIKNWA